MFGIFLKISKSSIKIGLGCKRRHASTYWISARYSGTIADYMPRCMYMSETNNYMFFGWMNLVLRKVLAIWFLEVLNIPHYKHSGTNWSVFLPNQNKVNSTHSRRNLFQNSNAPHFVRLGTKSTLFLTKTLFFHQVGPCRQSKY